MTKPASTNPAVSIVTRMHVLLHMNSGENPAKLDTGQIDVR